MRLENLTDKLINEVHKALLLKVILRQAPHYGGTRRADVFLNVFYKSKVLRRELRVFVSELLTRKLVSTLSLGFVLFFTHTKIE